MTTRTSRRAGFDKPVCKIFLVFVFEVCSNSITPAKSTYYNDVPTFLPSVPDAGDYSYIGQERLLDGRPEPARGPRVDRDIENRYISTRLSTRTIVC
jgi:hypothetical protein